VIAAFVTALARAVGTSSTVSTAVGHRTAEVQLRLDQYVVSGDDRPNATLVNTGDVRLVYVDPFRLERREKGAWHEINDGQAFLMPLWELRPGDTSRPQPISFYGPPGSRRELEPGLYRVSKAVWPVRSHPGGRRVIVTALFRVVAGAD
jgi:hypothetical protein